MKTPPSFNDRSSFAALKAYRAMPRGVWALGFVSMFMDISSELIHSLLPVFMAVSLGASMTTIGVVEGVAEAAAAMTKVFSGAISDYLGKRKALAGLGYGLAAFAKPIFPLANAIEWVFVARFIDRIGKGIRGAPRDALVADISPLELRGAAYGLRQSLDSVGAFVGPLIAMACILWLKSNIRAALWVAVIPAFISVGLLIFGVHDPEREKEVLGIGRHSIVTDAKRLPLKYWLTVLIGAIFTLARFSEAFLVIRAHDVELPLGYVPLTLIVMNVVYSVSAYPAGVAADRISGRTQLIVGLMTLIAADFMLAAAASPLYVFVGSALWGLHMGITQGLFSKLVADASPAKLRGLGFGVFNLVCGCALLPASIVAGALWSIFGAKVTFLTGAAFALLAVIGLITYRAKP